MQQRNNRGIVPKTKLFYQINLQHLGLKIYMLAVPGTESMLALSCHEKKVQKILILWFSSLMMQCNEFGWSTNSSVIVFLNPQIQFGCDLGVFVYNIGRRWKESGLVT